MGDRDTRRELLDVAEKLVRARGYNGFSYRDLAEQVGIKTASIHYHLAHEPFRRILAVPPPERTRAILRWI